ncbi:MAG: hypothetical protein A3G75_15985 [Verrucomicrobia bacterium RIFCSPLOWO2_12_FULL_64_8]|nr:MAG: hypothetical protein A3G75_15985 [Verrucomicrobia bacterium RIFCSPLOWO2_12_FULL_64_8]
MATTLFTRNIIACVWDFDKTLIPGYMQGPLFRHYGIDERKFWDETNRLAEFYAKRGYRISGEISYLNHILTYVRAGRMPMLNNRLLRKLGAEIKFYPGLPQFFEAAKGFLREKADYRKYELLVEHYIVSTGLAEMMRGSAIAAQIESIWGCEFIENPLQPDFLQQKEFEDELGADAEIAQIGTMIDNTTKTRALFEINKGTNKNPSLDVNARLPAEDRRIPFANMIYVADGPSDIPSFSVVKERGGKTYGVYNPDRPDEFKQNDELQRAGRIDHYGKADYREGSETCNWFKLQIQEIADRVVAEHEATVARKVKRPPRHLNPPPEEEAARRRARQPKQSSFLE